MKNSKEAITILSAIYCINRTGGHEDDDIYRILDYAFWRLFGANRNLLMLACIGQTKESIMPQVTAMLEKDTQYLEGVKKMTMKELYSKTFEEVIEELSEANENITSAISLKEYIKAIIDEDYLFLAIHLLNALWKSSADYYDYDYSMGTLETPTPLQSIADLENYCEEDKQ